MSPLGVPADLQSADKKGSTYLTADLQSASSENAQRRNEKPTAADFKSAKKRSNLFCLRIANPQGRLTGSRFLLPPCGFAFPPLSKTKKRACHKKWHARYSFISNKKILNSLIPDMKASVRNLRIIPLPPSQKPLRMAGGNSGKC